MNSNADYNAAMKLMQLHKPDRLPEDLGRLADLLNANTFAALALAYEARTANLIAERAHLDSIEPEERGDGYYDAYEKLTGLIDPRLGLDK